MQALNLHGVLLAAHVRMAERKIIRIGRGVRDWQTILQFDVDAMSKVEVSVMPGRNTVHVEHHASVVHAAGNPPGDSSLEPCPNGWGDACRKNGHLWSTLRRAPSCRPYDAC